MADEEKRPALRTEAGVGDLLGTIDRLPKLQTRSAAVEESTSPFPSIGADGAAAATPPAQPVFGDAAVPEAPLAGTDAAAAEEAGSPEDPPPLMRPDDPETEWDEVVEELWDVIGRDARPVDGEDEDQPRAAPPLPMAPPVFGDPPPQSPRPLTHAPRHHHHAGAAGAGGGGGIPSGDEGKDAYLYELGKTVKASMASYSTKKDLVARISEIANEPAKIATLGQPLPVDIAAMTVEITANMNEPPPPERAVFFAHYRNYLKNLAPLHRDCDLLSDERDSIRGVDAFAEAFVRGVLSLWYSPNAFQNTVAFIKDRTRRTASYNAAIDQRDRAAAIEWRIHEPMRATSQRAMISRTAGMNRLRDELRRGADKYLRQLQVHTVATTPVPSTAALIEALRSAAYAAYDPAPVPAHPMTFDVFRRPLLPQVVIGGNIALQDTLQGHARSDNELLEARKAAYRAHVDNVLGSARICTALEDARERYLKATKPQRTERVAPDAVPEAERANVAAELKSDGRGDVNRQSATRYSAQIALVERKFRDELHAWATTTRFPELFTGSSFIAGSEVASLKGPAWLGKHPKAP